MSRKTGGNLLIKWKESVRNYLMSLWKPSEHVFRVTWEGWKATKLWNKDLFSGKTNWNCPTLAKCIWSHKGVTESLAEGNLQSSEEHWCSGGTKRRTGGCLLTYSHAERATSFQYHFIKRKNNNVVIRTEVA